MNIIMSILGIIFYYLLSYADSYIIPNEIPTILSIVYSNIPPIKFGIDTRLGSGFRVGPHAEYQFLLEIGPQLNTKPISTNGTVPKNEYFALNRIQLFNTALNDVNERLKKRAQRRMAMKNGQKKSQKKPLEKMILKNDSDKVESFEKRESKSQTENIMKLDSPTRYSLLPSFPVKK